MSFQPLAPDHGRIAERWRAQYCRGGAWRYCGEGKNAA
jgi:hypothetical protein